MDKPIPMIIDETKQALVGALNTSRLPACILAPLVKELHEVVSQAAQAELEQARAEYAEEKKEEE